MKNALKLSILLTLIGCYDVKEESIQTGSSSSSPIRYKWSSFNKIIYSPALDTDTRILTEDMADQWNSNSEEFISVINAQPSSTKFAQNYNSVKQVNSDGYNGIYLLDENQWKSVGSYQTGTSLGVTLLLGYTDSKGTFNIVEADILLRENKMEKKDLPVNLSSNDDTKFDSETIILHELGHFLGLQHLTSNYYRNLSTMFPYIGTSDIKRTPTSLDFQNLNELYGINSGGSIPNNPRDGDEEAVPVGELTRIIIEMNADSDCRQYQEGVVTHSHKEKL